MSVQGGDYFVISRSGTEYRTPASEILAYIIANGGGGGGGSSAWGSITGTLSAQSDLAAALAGKQPLAAVLTGTTASFTTALETKLSGIASGATANSADATLLARANHTGTQLAATVSDFASASRAQTEAELVAGANITITPSGSGATRQLSIASSGVGTVTSVGGTGTVSGLTLTGTVTASGSLTLGGTLAVASANINADAVTYAKMQNVSAASVLLGRGSALGSGDPQEITLGTNLSMSGTTLNAAGGGSLTDGDKGDITVSSSGAVWTIDPATVTNAKLANVATATFKGRVTASTGDPEDLTGTQATTLLDAFTSGLKGLAPASGGGTANFLRADGTWAAPSGGSGSSPSFIYQLADRTLTSTTAAQKIFDQVTNGRLTLATGLYEYDITIYLTGMSAVAGNAAVDVLGAGTAVVSGALLQSVGLDNNSPLGSGGRTGLGAAGAPSVNLATPTTGTGALARISGVFLVTTAGTVIPSVALADAAAATLKAGTFLRLNRIAAASVYASADAD